MLLAVRLQDPAREEQLPARRPLPAQVCVRLRGGPPASLGLQLLRDVSVQLRLQPVAAVQRVRQVRGLGLVLVLNRLSLQLPVRVL